MSEERDPRLLELFSHPVDPAGPDDFAARVMQAVDHYTRRRRLAWLALELAAVSVLWLLSEPLQALVLQMVPGITSDLVDMGESPWAQLVAPVNSLAGVLAVSFLLGRSIYKRLF